MKIFITGGCKNGKSGIAEEIITKLAAGGPLYYIATMKAYDDEDRKRIIRHVAQRDGMGFETIEQPVRITEILDRIEAEKSSFLLDSVTALMINELYSTPDNPDDGKCDITVDSRAAERVAGDLRQLGLRAGNIIFVSDYIFMEKDNYSEYTREYLKALSYVDRALAEMCDVVCEVAFGNVVTYKGVCPL